MNGHTYFVLLADRKRAIFVLVNNGAVEKEEEHVVSDVPQKVKHGYDIRSQQDKILRHVEDHLHRHLQTVGKEAEAFVKGTLVTGILIGGHKDLFGKITGHLSQQLSKKIKGHFVAELKVPFNTVLKKIKTEIARIEGERPVVHFTHI